MKNFLTTIIVAVADIITAFNVLLRKLWLKLSRNVLMPNFGIETKAYRRWHERRAAKMQKAIDAELMRTQVKYIATL